MNNQTDDQQPQEVVEENKEETPTEEVQTEGSSEQQSSESEKVSPVENEAPAPVEATETPVQEAAPAPASNGYTDKPLNCRECGADFTWTAGEQEFYAQKGFENPPVRCPNCRQLKKQRQSRDQGPKQSYPITCSKCGKQDTVPFMPKGDQPLLCWDCFKGNR